MKHTRIGREPQRQPATYRQHLRKENEGRRRHFLYTIHGPDGYPFFPSDNELQTLVQNLPRIRFVGCDRLMDRDVLYVRGVEDNLFRADAQLGQVRERRRFLRTLSGRALAERSAIRPNVAEAAQRFLNDSGFVNVTWMGDHFVARKTPQDQCDSRFVGRFANEAIWFRRLQRVCGDDLPFFYGAALF